MPAEASVDHWEMLRRGGQASTALEIPSIDTGVETGSGSVRLALGNAGEFRLLLPVRQHERIAETPSSDALRIGVATYTLGGTPIRYLDMTCLVGALDGVFADVADEIMDRIVEGASPVEACRTTIEDFRSLLTTPSAEISIQEIRGLVGELLMLRTLLDLDPKAWRLWRGPLRERHDFHGGTVATEVKTTSRSATRRVTISAADQLLPPVGGLLTLAVFQLAETAGGDISVATLTADVMRAASDRQEVARLVSGYGCTDPESREWNRCRFRLDGEDHYLVDARFPRVIPENFTGGIVPNGVEKISYVVNLGAAEHCRLSNEDVEARNAELIACLDHL